MERKPDDDFDSRWSRYLDELFLQTVNDLAARSSRTQLDPYQSLGIAALLRKLLLDDQRLVDVVNRDRRVRWRVTMRAMHTQAPPPGFQGDPARLLHLHGDCLDPGVRCADAPPSIEVSRDSFLRHIVVAGDFGKKMTVREYIRYVAHVEGAVHVERRLESEFQRSIFMMGLLLNRSGGPRGDAQHYLLRALGRVVVAGLAPVVEAVQADLAAPAAKDGRAL